MMIYHHVVKIKWLKIAVLTTFIYNAQLQIQSEVKNMSVICPDCKSRLVKGSKMSKENYSVLTSSKIQTIYLPNLEQGNFS